jgi:hypothetical protein
MLVLNPTLDARLVIEGATLERTGSQVTLRFFCTSAGQLAELRRILNTRNDCAVGSPTNKEWPVVYVRDDGDAATSFPRQVSVLLMKERDTSPGEEEPAVGASDAQARFVDAVKAAFPDIESWSFGFTATVAEVHIDELLPRLERERLGQLAEGVGLGLKLMFVMSPGESEVAYTREPPTPA